MDARRLPLLPRRSLFLALPLVAACAGGEQPAALPPLVSGYGHLTPIRLNVAELELADPAAGAVRVDEPAPVRPEREMLRMAQDRLVPTGTEGKARFIVERAEFRREPLRAAGGLTGLFAGDPGERISVLLQSRLEVLSGEGRRVGFVETQARHQRTLPDGTSAAARGRAAEEAVRQAMQELNVEFEFQIRRALRPWLVEGAAPPSVPLGPGGIEVEELPRG
ncbi:hypothetical protein [Falsiroseomonas sp.]|uniref:hypothetical protein n=1 Tax=Falsiroseomonas sp. TaxID=2870721 RepID=UPI0035647046